MRNVKVAAIQPALIGIPQMYSPVSEGYVNDPAAIVENYVKKQLAITTKLLDEAGEQGCDIVSTCEDASVLSAFALDVSAANIFPQLVKFSHPLMEAAFAEIAKRYSMYVIGCYLKEHGGYVYNIAAIFDRKGRIVGEYRKTHLPANETWQCAAGDSLDVFELDFGKIGICICYDMMFPETVRVLSLKGAEVIFHPTFGYNWYDAIGEATLRTRANDNGVYLVTSKNYGYQCAGKSSVIDRWGQVLADAGFERNVIVTKQIDLDDKKVQPDWYFNAGLTGIGDVTERLSGERRPELYVALCDAVEKRVKIPDRGRQLELLEGVKSGKYHW